MGDGGEKMGCLRIEMVVEKWCSQYMPTKLLHPANELDRNETQTSLDPKAMM